MRALKFPVLSSGSATSVQSQPASIDAALHIARNRFHPLKPQYNLDWESKPKVAPPARSPCAERLLRRQVSWASEVVLSLVFIQCASRRLNLMWLQNYIRSRKKLERLK